MSVKPDPHKKKSHNTGQTLSPHNQRGDRQAKLRRKARPGHFLLESHIHDGAVVISGSVTVLSGATDIKVRIAEGLETAANEVTKRGGIVGHIKAAAVETSTSMISVTDEKAMVKDSPGKQVRITLSAIVFNIDPEAAESILGKSLASAVHD